MFQSCLLVFSCIKAILTLITGVFGRIYLGTMSSQVSDEDSPPVTVLIKTITGNVLLPDLMISPLFITSDAHTHVLVLAFI